MTIYTPNVGNEMDDFYKEYNRLMEEQPNSVGYYQEPWFDRDKQKWFIGFVITVDGVPQ